MLDESLLRKVLAAAAGKGSDLAEIFVEDKRSHALRLEDRRIEDVDSGREAGAGIRVLAGDRAAYAYTNVLTEESLLEAAAGARAELAEGPAEAIDLRTVDPGARHPVERPPLDTPTEDLVAALQAADDAARATDKAIRQVSASYAAVEQNVVIASSDGRIARDKRTRVRFVVQVVAARDGVIMTGFEAPGHSGGVELLDANPPVQVASSAAIKAVKMLDARPSPAGEFPVVLSPGSGGVLIHEACGHGLEGDTLVKDASVYAKREGEHFGMETVTIVDDGSDVGAWGSFGVDDEGTPSQRTVLFDRGVLVGCMTDLQSGKKLERSPSGNGRRQSYAHLPIVRMTNTYLLPGPDDPEEIIRSVERGVYAATFREEK